MRLTVTQLRSIIAEEVARVKRGRRLAEAADMQSVIDAASRKFYDTAIYDENDPLQIAVDEDDWNRQVDAANEEFVNKLAAALEGLADPTDPAMQRTVINREMGAVLKKINNGVYKYGEDPEEPGDVTSKDIARIVRQGTPDDYDSVAKLVSDLLNYRYPDHEVVDPVEVISDELANVISDSGEALDFDAFAMAQAICDEFQL